MGNSDWISFRDKLRIYVKARVDARFVDDMVSTILLRLVQSQDQLSKAKTPIAWVYRVAANVITDHYRSHAAGKRKHDAFRQEHGVNSEGKDESALLELAFCVEPFIKSLPAPYDQALLLTDLQGLSQKQAAEKLGVSLSGMKSRVQRAREKLKSRLLACCKIELGHDGSIIDVEPKGVVPQRCCNSGKAI